MRDEGRLVLVAEPGAGKTTRVPRALLDAGLAGDGEIVVLEPRRLAARMAARRVAEELGEPVGERVGWQVRFEDVSSPRTRVRFVTEGILGRRLHDDPCLRGISCVLLDEFHERHLHGDLALALLRRLRRTARPDLLLAVMSATLEADAVARFLGVDVASVPGRMFPVDVRHAERGSVSPEHRPPEVASRVAQALRGLLDEGPLDGDVLVFLAGAAEIRAALEACAPLRARHDLLLVPLHGDLPAAEQDRAVRSALRRKVILSTNVAETSVTIDGVTTVIDTGLARVVRHSPWSGLPSRRTARISRASATQRAGRAGRTRPGRCLRLFTKTDHDARPDHDPPEIARADLAETVLALRASDGAAGDLEWLEPPPPAAVDAAVELLRRLGALGPAGDVTPLGRRMLALPLHPRLARLALEADALGKRDDGCLLAALLAERDVRTAERSSFGGRAPTRRVVAGSSDLLDRLDAVRAVERRASDTATLGVDPGALHAVLRARDQIAAALRRLAGPDSRAAASGRSGRRPAPKGLGGRAAEEAAIRRPQGPDSGPEPARGEEAALRAVLAAFPDRVARRRSPRSEELLLCGGGAARLSDESTVRDAELLVAVDVEERPERMSSERSLPLVRAASAVEPEWLLEMFSDRMSESEEVRFVAKAERVESSRRLLYERLVLHETRGPASGPEAGRVLAQAALAAGPDAFGDADELAAWRARLEFAAGLDPSLPRAADDDVAEALRSLAAGRRSFAEMRDAGSGGLLGALRDRLTPAQRSRLERLAPERVELAGGRRLRVHYEAGRTPWVESRLQDFFGLATGPRAGDGRVPLVLHLLAPSRRPVQITTDLAGFWERHYPAIRRELMRRYPKHAWPENPRRG
ncbi:MAG: ATP-dependent helicase HrpB [Deltaproteobacteria bacterium]|nr:ATP-dependent helicase HrpB [Deltaproteobacteria bacterium]